MKTLKNHIVLPGNDWDLLRWVAEVRGETGAGRPNVSKVIGTLVAAARKDLEAEVATARSWKEPGEKTK